MFFFFSVFLCVCVSILNNKITTEKSFFLEVFLSCQRFKLAVEIFDFRDLLNFLLVECDWWWWRLVMNAVKSKVVDSGGDE